ncbi:hypothetical protein LLE49_23120 [Alicyclobacillus tolerans]|uniref:hypothetical protein n=1 Tax=Alicyclobacillus tolerans TaxID=90970 RepID=UPI001F385054|nr:hypothetical protein [Alicyclobacillus tolerans]MCF8567615.1 hypothetical protein [Alicyclobacillus tolerans]
MNITSALREPTGSRRKIPSDVIEDKALREWYNRWRTRRTERLLVNLFAQSCKTRVNLIERV